KTAVAKGVLRSGIMYECVRHNIPHVLAGSVRDDGPLPEVITDVLVAQQRMRELIRGVGFSLMIATALHAIATGNLLPAWVKVACVDINPATVTKLADRGSIQTVGIVTDAEPFLRALLSELETGKTAASAPQCGISMNQAPSGSLTPVDTAKIADRRVLRFDSLDQMLAEVDRLVDAERIGRLKRLGNWTLGQTLGHLATWMEFGYTG